MRISCSSNQEIWNIPESGKALLAGYWSPEEGFISQKSWVKWQEGIITSLEPINPSDQEKETSPETNFRNSFVWNSYYLMPGWLDAHIHLALDSIDFYQCLDNWSQPELINANIQSYLRHYLEQGIVGVRDGGDLPGFAWEAKQKVDSGEWVGPQILSVHEAVQRKGKYGRFLGRGFKTIQEWRDLQEGFFAQGLDHLKIVVTGLIKFDTYGVVGPTQWEVGELKEFVESAHDRGISVMAHASGTAGISVAIEAGVDSIEHGYYVTTEQLKRMQAKGITWVPTVAPIGNILKYDAVRYSEQERSVLTRILQGHLAKIQEAYQLKVSLGVGTDAGAFLVPHGDAFFDELEWFNDAGLPKDEILRRATQGNARIFGWQDFGTLKIGSRINRLQLTSDPYNRQ
jgi:imidazolonepropionase-like amidohydrolase